MEVILKRVRPFNEKESIEHDLFYRIKLKKDENIRVESQVMDKFIS